MKTSELLRKAADEIRRRGWHQQDYGSDLDAPNSCSVCAVGGLRAALTGDPWEEGQDYATYGAALERLDVASGLISIPRWNDTEGRTVEEVLEAFERAAVAAEGEGD